MIKEEQGECVMEQRDYVAEGYGIEDCYEDTGGLPHHDAVDGCGDNIVHSKCAGCTYEQDALSAYPCNDCWNGDGDGERCYYDGAIMKVKYIGASEEQITFFLTQESRGVLVEGELYEVDRIEEHSWHTRVYLKDYPGRGFNSVCFEEV